MTISKQNVIDAIELWMATHFKVPPKVTDVVNEQYKEEYVVTFQQDDDEGVVP